MIHYTADQIFDMLDSKETIANLQDAQELHNYIYTNRHLYSHDDLGCFYNSLEIFNKLNREKQQL